MPPKRCHLPAECPDTLKQMIRQCWDNDKALRPTFQEIDASLRQLDATNVNPLGAMRSKQRSTSRSARRPPVLPSLARGVAARVPSFSRVVGCEMRW